MKLTNLKSEVNNHLKTLEAIYFLVHQLGNNAGRLRMIQRVWPELSRKDKLRLRDELRSEVEWARGEVGAIAPNSHYQKLLDEIRAYPGYAYLHKLYIDRELFTNYAEFFPRWPYMKLHAAAIFDGSKDEGTGQVYEMEGPCLKDARVFIARAKVAEKGIEDFRKRAKEDQLEALRFARASIIATLTFVEVYLNGLAYDCFQENHDKLAIEDHDLLGEWDSANKRRRFVDFREKVFKYPVIVGRLRGRKIDLSGFREAHDLVNTAKEFRDALVHPSPFVDPKTREFEKFLVAVGANRKIAEEILRLAVVYAEFVETSIGNDPRLAAPWLYQETDEVKEAKQQKLEGASAAPSVDSAR